jgi:hypothetical protein
MKKIKIAVVGDGEFKTLILFATINLHVVDGVGKTSLISTFLKEQFEEV